MASSCVLLTDEFVSCQRRRRVQRSCLIFQKTALFLALHRYFVFSSKLFESTHRIQFSSGYPVGTRHRILTCVSVEICWKRHSRQSATRPLPIIYIHIVRSANDRSQPVSHLPLPSKARVFVVFAFIGNKERYTVYACILNYTPYKCVKIYMILWLHNLYNM